MGGLTEEAEREIRMIKSILVIFFAVIAFLMFIVAIAKKHQSHNSKSIFYVSVIISAIGGFILYGCSYAELMDNMILAIVFMFGVVVGCVVWYKTATTPFDETAEPLFTKEDYPRVDASLAIHPLVDAIAAVETGRQDKPLTPVTILSIDVKEW